MKNKKGFTLIELLAVIVILAVIMVIAVPKILDIINSSRESAAESSIKLVKDAIKTQVSTGQMSGVSFEKEGECYLFDFENNNNNALNLSLKNKDKIGGSIKYCNGKFEEDTLTFDGTNVSNGGTTTVAFVPTYFAFGTPTTSSTTDYTTLGKNVFTGLASDGTTRGVCINDGKLFCIKANDYEKSIESLKSHFGESNCRVFESYLLCNSDAFVCRADAVGYVRCNDSSTNKYCAAYANGSLYCE